MFELNDQVVVITGGGGVLCGEMARAMTQAGAQVAVLDLAEDAAKQVAADCGEKACAFKSNVLDRDDLDRVAGEVIDRFGKVDILINGAGGNKPQATTAPDRTFFDLDPDAIRFVLDLNLMGTLLPCQVFGRHMAERKSGNIINISSMNALRPLTKIAGYSAAKAAVSNFTQWLAVHMAQNHSPKIRVNAMAPGFFLTDQNRYLLTDKETGDLTPRGKTILDHTPMARLGAPEDLNGTLIWLASPASAFVTGIVVPIDGGFSAFSGV